MSIQTQTTSFKSECWQAVHDLLNDDIYIALYTGNASLDQDTTVYSTTDEVVASGYSAGGQQLLTPTIGTDGFTVYADFADVSWNAALTARYALIYNASKGNKSIAVLDFGADKTSVLTFTVTFPANTSSSAVLRSSN
jgi:hypothetical protein